MGHETNGLSQCFMATNITYTTAEIIRIAKSQKMVNWLILWGIVAIFGVGFTSGFVPQIESILPIILITYGIIAAILIYQLAVALKTSNPWIWALVVLLPYGCLVVMLILSLRATKALRLRGIRVGLMGASKRDLPSDDSLSQESQSLAAISTPVSHQPTPENAVESDCIPCPLCGQRISIATLKRGENWCPHCSEKFVAE